MGWNKSKTTRLSQSNTSGAEWQARAVQSRHHNAIFNHVHLFPCFWNDCSSRGCYHLSQPFTPWPLLWTHLELPEKSFHVNNISLSCTFQAYVINSDARRISLLVISPTLTAQSRLSSSLFLSPYLHHHCEWAKLKGAGLIRPHGNTARGHLNLMMERQDLLVRLR